MLDERRLASLSVARDAASRARHACQRCGKDMPTSGKVAHERACSAGHPCPVCGKWVVPVSGKKSVTCSKSCANTHFRTGPSHPNWKEDRYRSTCFAHHAKRCVVCGEERIVEVHHLDEDANNNDPGNLIPLCPTHHAYWHSRYRTIIESVVRRYADEWRKGFAG